MNAFIEAYPYIVLSMGAFAAFVVMLNGAIASCGLVLGAMTEDLGQRLWFSGISTAASCSAAALILAATKWLISAPVA